MEQILWHILAFLVWSLQWWRCWRQTGGCCMQFCLKSYLTLVCSHILYMTTFRLLYMDLVCAQSMVAPYLSHLWGVNFPCSFPSLIFVLVLTEFVYIFQISWTEALSRLNVVILHPQARNPENVMAYDNAVSALGKICQFHRDSIDSSLVCLFVFLLFSIVVGLSGMGEINFYTTKVQN